MAAQQRLTHIQPPDVTPGSGYSHVVTGTGRLVAVSGQVAIGEDGRLVGPGDPSAQARQVFENLRRCLGAVGLSFDEVIKLTYYVTDVAHLPAIRAVRDEFVDTARPPAPRCRWWRWSARSSCWRWRRSRWPGTASSGGWRPLATEGG
jgi:enamine deaminase RidA (YjgF/YER057c/UK114 family)